MKRLLLRLVALAVLGVLVTIPAWGAGDDGTSAGTEPTRITDYLADFAVDADGGLRAVETITVDFPVGAPRHGIFRFFDTHDAGDAHLRHVPRDIEVTQDGAPAIVDVSREDGGRHRVVRIGDPDAFVQPGRHTYRISYRIDGALGGSAGARALGDAGTTSRSEFYWNLVPGGWAQEIDRATLRVSLPAAAEFADCAVGAGATDGCTPAGVGTDELTVRVEHLPARTPVTIRAGMDLPDPGTAQTLPWTGRWDGVLGEHGWVPWVAGVIAVLAAAAGGWASRRAREDRPGFPLQYAPPEGIGPAQAEYVRTEDVPREAFVASVMQAAERDAVTLDRDGDTWTITDTGRWDGIDPGTAAVRGLLESAGGSFTAEKKSVQGGEALKSAIADFEKRVKDWGRSSGTLSKLRFGGLAALATIAGLAAALAVVIFQPFHATAWAFVPGAFGIFGLGSLSTGATTVRTRSGRDLWSRVGGFHRVLSTPSSEARFEFSGREELYTSYLPWAVAFGCAEVWADKFHTETGTEPPVPAYFAGFAGAHGADAATAMVASFDSTVDAAISSYEATQSSSSSGGGFSGGGGGGGGGGGSW